MPKSRGRKKTKPGKGAARPVQGRVRRRIVQKQGIAALVAAQELLGTWISGVPPRPAELPVLWEGWDTFTSVADSLIKVVVDERGTAADMSTSVGRSREQMINYVMAVYGPHLTAAGVSAADARRLILTRLLPVYTAAFPHASARHDMFLSATPAHRAGLPAFTAVDTEGAPVVYTDLSGKLPGTEHGDAGSGFGLCVHGTGDQCRLVFWGTIHPGRGSTDASGVCVVSPLMEQLRAALARAVTVLDNAVHPDQPVTYDSLDLSQFILPYSMLHSQDQVAWSLIGGNHFVDIDTDPHHLPVQVALACIAAEHPATSASGDTGEPSPPRSADTGTPSRHRDAPAVRVIDLSAPRTPRREGTTSGAMRAVPDHRWPVQGHWRNQACGPGRTERKRVWIADHENGPKGKPLGTARPVVRRVDLGEV